jgi:hypothetical protein
VTGTWPLNWRRPTATFRVPIPTCPGAGGATSTGTGTPTIIDVTNNSNVTNNIYEQAETAVAVDRLTNQVVVAFIDYQAATVAGTIAYPNGYPNDPRVVLPGASLMGWAYGTNGTSWTYNGDVVSPPKGWVIWSVPSVAAAPGKTWFYQARMGATTDQFPPTGLSNTDLNFVGDFNGFCVAQSIDDGKTFPDANVDCFQHKTCLDPTTKASMGPECGAPGMPMCPPGTVCGGNTIDGTSLAVSENFAYFATFSGDNPSRHDVWVAKLAMGKPAFERMTTADPFAGHAVVGHPRLKFSTTAAGGRIYLLSHVGLGEVWATYLDEDPNAPFPNVGTWQPPMRVSAGGIKAAVGVAFSGMHTLRVANQFSFDVVDDSTLAVHELRVMYGAIGKFASASCMNGDTQQSLVVASCPINDTMGVPAIGTCASVPVTGGQCGDQYNPLLRAYASGLVQWKASWVSHDPTGSTVAREFADLNGFTPNPLTPPEMPCTTLEQDTSATPPMKDEFWGDYEEGDTIPCQADGLRFLRAITRNPGTCGPFQTYWTADMHVGVVLY